MRAALALTIVTLGLAAHANAEPLPPGSIGLVSGVASGTGADAKRIGAGVLADTHLPWVGVQAAWQPTSTERAWGWTLRWSTMIGTLYGGNAAHIDSALRTVQMDLTIGLRFRPWTTPSRYLTLRGGGELLRANEPIMTAQSTSASSGNRAFFGPIASLGLDQYLGSVMFNIDVKYGMIGTDGPSQLALLVGINVAGP